MSWKFSDENLQKIEKLRTRYPSPNALVLPLLWMAQEQDGFIKLDAIESIANIADVSSMDVYKVITFYSMFHLSPVGKYEISICKTLSCKLNGKDEILKHLKEKLNLDVGKTSADGRFTLTQVECLGCCGSAPMMQINGKNYENVTAQMIDEILGSLSE